MRKYPVVAAITFSLALCACGSISTVEGRIQEQSATFAAASPREQNIMKRGLVAAGFTPNMVYIALDKPDSTAKLSDGHTERWIYRNFGQDPGSFTLGGTKLQSGGTFGGGVSVARAAGTGPRGSSNVSQGSASTRADPSQAVDAWQRNLVITFTDGKLTAMELLEM
jgi:hypothetical protein